MQPHILVISVDPSLAEEVESAVAAMRNVQPVVRSSNELRQGVEAARSWQPQIILVELAADLAAARHRVADLIAAAPQAQVVGILPSELFDQEARQGALLIEAVRAGARDFVRRPVSRTDLEPLLERLSQRSAAPRPKFGRLVSFVSNKGGVGKSTLTVNVAAALAQAHPDQVLLVDASLQIGSCASLLNLKPATTLADAARQRDRLDETLIRQLAAPHASGLHVLAAPAEVVEAVDVTDEVISRVLTLARRTYDYVIVDTFPSVDRVAMAVLDLSDLVYIVLESVVPTLLGGAKLLNLLNSLAVPVERQRIVLNRVQRLGGNPRPIEAAERLGRPVDHVLRYDHRIVAAANLGEPYILSAGRFSACRRDLLPVVREVEQLTGAVPAVERNGTSHQAPMSAEAQS